MSLPPPVILPVPENIFSKHAVLLGITGSGKSSLMRALVEDRLRQGKRCVVIDPKGDWWGLKVGADGKSAGYPVILFGDFKGGVSGDVPITEHSGAELARLIMSGNRPCVIGMRGWMPAKASRFWIEFASTLFNENDAELYLFVDEIQNFAPKERAGFGDENMALYWTKKLLSEGRGLGLTMFVGSQRPQAVHNGVLTQCETLFAMRLTHDADCTAAETWLKRTKDKTLKQTIMDSIPEMGVGQAWVWSPSIKFGPEKVQFPLFSTFDSFAPPQKQKKVSTSGWAGVDLEAVRSKFAVVIEEAEANNPKKLKQQLSGMQTQFAAIETEFGKLGLTYDAAQNMAVNVTRALRAKPVKSSPPEKVYVVEDKDLKLVKEALEQSREVFEAQSQLVAELGTMGQVRDRLHAMHTTLLSISTATIAIPPGATQPPRLVMSQRHDPRKFGGTLPDADTATTFERHAEPRPRQLYKAAIGDARVILVPAKDGREEFRLNGTQQRILDAVAFFASIGVNAPKTSQIGAVAKMDTTGGHFSNNVSPLSTAGLVIRGSGTLSLTEEGMAYAKMPEVPPTLEAYHDFLRVRVRQCKSAGGKTVDILNVIISNGNNPISTAAIGEALTIDHTGGHFSNLITPISTCGLIERRDGMVTPTDILFPPGLS